LSADDLNDLEYVALLLRDGGAATNAKQREGCSDHHQQHLATPPPTTHHSDPRARSDEQDQLTPNLMPIVWQPKTNGPRLVVSDLVASRLQPTEFGLFASPSPSGASPPMALPTSTELLLSMAPDRNCTSAAQPPSQDHPTSDPPPSFWRLLNRYARRMS
jgi:hypothetical protein